MLSTSPEPTLVCAACGCRFYSQALWEAHVNSHNNVFHQDVNKKFRDNEKTFWLTEKGQEYAAKLWGFDSWGEFVAWRNEDPPFPEESADDYRERRKKPRSW